ncbi:MAG TPA: hypothetical protein VKN99_16485 [Polyangia bacterium]|nr:hypothetical protein [Polyangia bacterium]
MPVALLVLAALLALAAPSEQFDRAKLAYERNEYSRVIALVKPLLYPSIQLSSQEQVAEAHRLLGIALFKTHDEASAEKEFAILLNNNPDFHLDRLVDGVEVAQFVDQMRRRMEDELKRAKQLEQTRQEEERKRKQKEEEERRHRIQYVDREVRIIEHSYFVNFLPFGAGQLQNGQHQKGYALMISEGVLLAGSVGLWIAKQELYPDGKVHTPSQSESAATALQVARITTGGVFLGLWALGVWDALHHYVPTTKVYVPAPMPLQSGLGLEWNGRF